MGTDLRDAARQALVDMACVRDMVAHPDNLQFIDKAITALRAALEQPEPFQPDWDRIEPLQEALREHMAEIHRLRAALEQPERAQQQRDAGFTRRPTIREMSEPEQPEQEPMAWRFKTLVNQEFETDWALTKYEPPNGVNVVAIEPLFTHPPRREWRGLTDEERQRVYDEAPAIEGVDYIPHGFARAIEAKLKEKNHE
jgi:hypothetical protein